MIKYEDRVPKEETLKEDAVERIFCSKFDNLKRHPMTETETRVMLSLMLSNIGDDDKELNDQFLCRIVKSRLQFLGYLIDAKAMVFVSYISGTPGTAVMYVHYMAHYCKKNGLTRVTFNELCENMFPFGFPSMDDLSNLWDEQKVKTDGIGPDNLLDYMQASISIMNGEFFKISSNEEEA